MPLAQVVLRSLHAVVVEYDLQRRWEPWRWGAAIKRWHWPAESIIRADPLTSTSQVAKELSVNHAMVIQHLKQIGEVVKLDKWAPHELTANQKSPHSEGLSSLLHNNKPFLDWIVTCNKKKIVYNNQRWPAQWSTEKKLQSTSQSQNCIKKTVRVTVCWSVAHRSHYSFLNPGETITSEKYRKSKRCTRNCKARSHHWSTERAQFFLMTTPNCISHNQCLKSHQLGYKSFASSTIFTWPLPKHLPLLQVSWQLFPGKMLSQRAGDRKSFPRAHHIQRHGFLCYMNKQFYFHWQKCVDCNGSYFD